MWIQRNIHKWKKVRKYFIDLQNRFISDYLETLVYGYKIDLKMYKDIYKNIYDVQEYLRENDKKGFNSFNKAFEALKIDLSKYTNKVEEPHVKLVDISE
jgi:protein associated with RNAse G/E